MDVDADCFNGKSKLVGGVRSGDANLSGGLLQHSRLDKKNILIPENTIC